MCCFTNLLSCLFHLLGEVINCNQNQLMSVQCWRVDFLDDVDSPSRKWPWGTQSLQVHHWPLSKVRMVLSHLTLTNKLVIVCHHRTPVITHSLELLSNHSSIHVRTTFSSMYLFHQLPCMSLSHGKEEYFIIQPPI